MKHPHKILFYFLMVSSTILVLSSSSWLITWMGLEINMLGFIPLMFNQQNTNESETAVKYLLPQSMASTIFITAAMISIHMNIAQMLLAIAMCLKLGAAPFHLWFPPVMAGLELLPAFILLTWQKIAPIFAISSMEQNFPSKMLLIASISAVWGGIGGLNQTDIRSLLTYSSIAHTGWMIATITTNIQTLLIYMLTYITINISIYLSLSKIPTNSHKQLFIMNQNNNTTLLIISILSLGGLPPFTGFIMKLLVIYSIKTSLLTLSFLILGALTSLFFYLSFLFSPLLNSFKTYQNQPNLKELSIFLIMTQILPLSSLFLFF
uniref:NADH-ubiquinone oxidoreductase chain 2 n=1 Tax=Rectidens sumatrensis TaxID=1903498 RepID=A0A8A3WMX0_9BIVA|nr:NADH dehydrogenase subunit 2 [Rectidens sumatrensis]QTA71722.1 NADH dehydrogenase subunit 2 [Rectidens sumatrensis]